MGKGWRRLHRGLLMALVSAVLVLASGGCGKSRESTAKDPNVAAQPGAPSAAQQTCFNCAGAGLVPCRAPGCIAGKVECPGPCLKLSRGTWIHMNVPGHSPNELWIKFTN